MDLKSRYQADAKKVDDGVEIPVGDAFFTMAYYGSTSAQMSFHSHIAKFKKEHNDKQAVIMAMQETLVEDIVFGFRNLKEDKKKLKYSKKELRRLLETYVGLDAELMEKANDIENYKSEVKEAITKK